MRNFTAVYLRLSKDDRGRNTSESIENQKEFIIEYINKNNMGQYIVYTDDGFSGTDFERPAFKQMISDIEEKIIHTVITKDMSRLGRNHIKTSYYIEEYFPERQVRYIALNDSIDTKMNPWDDISPFKAVINEMYSKDLSRKIRTALNIKKKNGKFIGSIAPYGYKKHPYNKNLLIKDEKTAVVVKKIFDLYIKGESIRSITEILNSSGEPTPSQKINSKNKSSKWNGVTIKNILRNETYTGNVTQNKSMKISYKINKKIVLPKSQWICVADTHEGIIDKEQFELANIILNLKSYNSERRKTVHILSGFVFCDDCGAPMSFTSQGESRSYMVCSNWKQRYLSQKCSSHCCREQYVEDTVNNTLKKLAIENIVLLTENFEKLNPNAQSKKFFIENIINLDCMERSELAMLIDKIYISKDKMLTIILR